LYQHILRVWMGVWISHVLEIYGVKFHITVVGA
jgi:hypothetical protein